MADNMEPESITDIGFDSVQQYRFPNIVNLCVIRGDCPCRCVHCPVGRTPPDERHARFGNSAMSLELFGHIVGEMAGFPHSTLRIHGVGDPILWPELPEALKMADSRKIRTWLFTSLVTSDIKLLAHLALHCTIIEVSVNSYDKDNYLITKGINSFDRVTRNIRILRTMADSTDRPLRIIASRVQSNDRIYDAEFIAYWKKSNLPDDVFIRSYHDYNGLLEKESDGAPADIIPCLVHWNRFNVDCDGNAVVCFNELFKGTETDSRLVYGNVNDHSIAAMWHSQTITRIRNAQLQKDYTGADMEYLPCKTCTSCQPKNHGTRPTSENQINKLSNRNTDGNI